MNKLSLSTFLFCLLMAYPSWAQTPLAQFNPAAGAIHNEAQPIGLGIGIIATLGMAALALLGRFKWSWLFTIVGSLVVIGGSPYIVDFVSGSDTNTLSDRTIDLAQSSGDWTQNISYGIGIFGTIGAVAYSIMSGRFRWSWMFAIIGGFIVLGGMASFFEYMTGNTPI